MIWRESIVLNWTTVFHIYYILWPIQLTKNGRTMVPILKHWHCRTFPYFHWRFCFFKIVSIFVDTRAQLY